MTRHRSSVARHQRRGLRQVRESAVLPDSVAVINLAERDRGEARHARATRTIGNVMLVVGTGDD